MPRLGPNRAASNCETGLTVEGKAMFGIPRRRKWAWAVRIGNSIVCGTAHARTVGAVRRMVLGLYPVLAAYPELKVEVAEAA